MAGPAAPAEPCAPGGGGNPPRTAPRRPGGRWHRRLAAAGVLAALAVAATAAWRGTGSVRTVPPAPTRLTLNVTASDGTRLRVPSAGSRPTVLIYVSPDCRHCHAELARWGEVARRDPGLLSRVDVVVVSPPRAGDASWISSGLPHRYVRDGNGEIARRLGVRAVPFCVYADPSGAVRRVTVGETGTEPIARSLRLIAGVGA